MQTPEIELVINGVTGVLCKDGDVADFAEAVVRLLTNEKDRRKMSENAFRVVKAKYNIENMAKGFFDAVAYCVGDKNKTEKDTCK